MALTALARDKYVPPGVNQDGSGETLRTPIGGCNFVGDYTLALLCKFTGRDAAFQNLLSSLSSGGVVTGWSMEKNLSNQITADNGTASQTSTTTTAVADGWCLHVSTKATGTVTPRYHRYKYLTGAWVHENFSGTLANGTAPGTTGLVEIGGKYGTATDNFQGEILATAVWNRVLTDGEVVPLAFTYTAWAGSRPVGFWRPRGRELVRDLTHRGANELTRTGLRPTTITVTSLPLPNIDDAQPRDSMLLNLLSSGFIAPRELRALQAVNQSNTY